MRKLLAAAAVAAAIGLAPAHAAWPEKNVRIVVPYAPGGSTDNTMRAVHPALEEILGRTITLENIGGGAGLIGTGRALNAEPDGYTFSINPVATLANVYTREVPYDVDEQVQPVARVARSYVALAVRPDLPVENAQELVAYARENPGLTYGSAGVGSITHLYAELFVEATGVEMTHVPYRGSSEALNALMGGHIDVLVDSNLLPQLQTGAIKGIGYINDERWPGYPELPTLAEQGIEVQHLSWFGLITRKGAPEEAVNGMAAAVEEALKREDVQKRLENLALYPGFLGPEEFAEQIKRDQAAFRSVAEKLGLVK